MSYSHICPYCGKEMAYFVKTPTMNTLACKECKSMFTVKTSWGIVQDTILTGITALTGIIALIAFFGIHSIDDLTKSK
jgi:transposase-like protein